MKSMILGVFFTLLLGMIMVSTQSFGNSLSTTSQINKIGTLDISDSTSRTLSGVNLGVSDEISSVTLSFIDQIPDSTNLNISLRNSVGTEIGVGSVLVSPASSSATINLSDTVTAVERESLESIIVSIS
ncbi:hypothetical protein [Nitrosopumilus sp.]|uniref:hypothetical protein n=1 Tax=Nitrosopumilus sp. TaxID=2024843 RepID=UPI002636C646|nr:hypothetical protein [Nitrosopumilus sp.]